MGNILWFRNVIDFRFISFYILDGLTCKEFFDMDEDLKTLTINKAIYKEIKIEIVSENNQYMGKTSSRHTLKKIK